MVAPRPIRAVDLARVPGHVAIIMDGNGRWAQARGLERSAGHEAGESALFEAISGCLETGISALTVYAFSTENWSRPKDEVRFLLNFNRSLLRRRRDELNDRGVRVSFTGRRNYRVPKGVLNEMVKTEEMTISNSALHLVIAFNYGGRAEIVDAVRSIVSEPISPTSVSEATISKHLYLPQLSDPDLMLRTSGEVRTSNFLIWQLAYSELIFMDVLWPDFTREHLFGAIAEFQTRVRRFGRA